MIYPISQFSCNYNKYCQFSNSNIQSKLTFRKEKTNSGKKTPTTEESLAHLNGAMQKLTAIVTLLGISAICFGIAKHINNPSTEGTFHSEMFRSLADDNTIPILKTCKSLDKNLRSVLENQLAVAQANDKVIKEAGHPAGKNRFLLCGPPGVGKSYFAKIYAKTLGASYKEIKFSDFNGRWVGLHNENLKAEFNSVIHTAASQPDKKFVVTFNEIDAIIIPRESMVNALGFKPEERSIFLNYLDECSEKVPNLTIIGTSNLAASAQNLDGAAMSRFKNIYEIPFPDSECLYEATKAHLSKIKDGNSFINRNDEKLKQFSKEMEDRKFSFRDLENVINTAKDNYIRDKVANKDTGFLFEYLTNAKNGLAKSDGEMQQKVK